jgi:hypothetical protein
MKHKVNSGMAKHEQTVDWLVQRLIDSGKFDYVQKDTHYNVGGVNGQVDAMAYIHVTEEGQDIKLFYFYEVKSSYSPKNARRASEQFKRFKSVHPKMRLEGYLVTPTRIERLG